MPLFISFWAFDQWRRRDNVGRTWMLTRVEPMAGASTRRVVALASALALFGLGGGLSAALESGSAAAGASPPLPVSQGGSPARCGAHDTPETGLQGDVPKADQVSGRAAQGYNCGLAVVGHSDLGGAGASDLAWSGHCAYVKDLSGSLITPDVSDPT